MRTVEQALAWLRTGGWRGLASICLEHPALTAASALRILTVNVIARALP
jgi:hypothetical protein